MFVLYFKQSDHYPPPVVCKGWATIKIGVHTKYEPNRLTRLTRAHQKFSGFFFVCKNKPRKEAQKGSLGLTGLSGVVSVQNEPRKIFETH